jgi:hypothetical protein
MQFASSTGFTRVRKKPSGSATAGDVPLHPARIEMPAVRARASNIRWSRVEVFMRFEFLVADDC